MRAKKMCKTDYLHLVTDDGDIQSQPGPLLTKLPKLVRRCWIHDLTEDGDVESHPGPLLAGAD